jgi:hypothetical protein
MDLLIFIFVILAGGAVGGIIGGIVAATLWKLLV